MKIFFDNQERIDRLMLEAGLWIGTPFHAHARVRQAGVDCVQLVGSLYIATGVLKTFTPPNYSMDGGHHNDTSLVIDYVEKTGRFVAVKNHRQMLAGDLLCFRVGKAVHHVGIYLSNGQFIHTIERAGTRLSLVEDPTWAKRLTVVYRPIES